jgi:hypothetical protein
MSDPGANVGLLFLTECLGFGVGKMRQRHRGPIEIGLDEFCCGWHGDMGMNVDRYAIGPQLAPRPTLAARGGWGIFVPMSRHERSSLTSPRRAREAMVER